MSEGLGILLVAAIITLVMFTSPRERRLLLGAPGDPGLLPDNPVAAGVAASRIITGPGACRQPDGDVARRRRRRRYPVMRSAASRPEISTIGTRRPAVCRTR